MSTLRAPKSVASLTVQRNNSAATSHKLDQVIISIGCKQINKHDIVVDASFISAPHCLIYYDGDQYFLIHPHPDKKYTRNGLVFKEAANNSIRQVLGNTQFKQALNNGDEFSICCDREQVTFHFTEKRSTVQAPHVKPIKLNKPEITLGRLSANDVPLDHPQVSGHHATLKKRGSEYYIVDEHSTNHTYVNSQRVTKSLLKLNDEIRIGPFVFTYHGKQLTQSIASPAIDIAALNLNKVVRKNGKSKTLLHDISLVIPAGSFVALVGASGAGKSTLLDALNGLRPAEGTILYDSQDYYTSFEAFRSQLGYVPQDDIIHRDLTVERALYYAACLRLPDDYPSAQIKQRIDEVLKDVEMAEPRTRTMPISLLSGGQRKRTSMALELLAKPGVFFLDEPTSGLDPGLDRKMMKLLRMLASKGQTIVMVTHATSNITECDYVCFLANEGRVVYFGPPGEATSFFKEKDFADIYIKLDKQKNSEIGEKIFLASQYYKEYIEQPLHQMHQKVQDQEHQKPYGKPRGNPWRQFMLLSLRYLELLTNDWRNLLILSLQAPIIACILLLFVQFGIGSGGFEPTNVVQCPTTAHVLISSDYPDTPNPANPIVSKSCSSLEHFLSTNPRGKAYAAKHGGTRQALQDFIFPGPGDAPKILFIMAFAAIMFGCINAAREVVKELSIYKRERLVNIGIIPYLFSKIVVLGVLCLLQCAV